jgi:hypothetical protein
MCIIRRRHSCGVSRDARARHPETGTATDELAGIGTARLESVRRPALRMPDEAVFSRVLTDIDATPDADLRSRTFRKSRQHGMPSAAVYRSGKSEIPIETKVATLLHLRICVGHCRICGQKC